MTNSLFNNAYFSENAMVDILSQLPFDVCQNFMSVSRNWHNSFNTPFFKKAHCQKAKITHSFFLLLSWPSQVLGRSRLELIDMRTRSRQALELPHFLHCSQHNVRVLGIINGQILLRANYVYRHHQLLAINLVTRRCQQITAPFIGYLIIFFPCLIFSAMSLFY